MSDLPVVIDVEPLSTEVLEIDVFDIPVPPETPSPDPVYPKDIALYGCDSKFGIMKSNLSIQIDVLGLEPVRTFVYFKEPQKGFLTNCSDFSGMKGFEVYECGAVRIIVYQGFGEATPAYWILDHAERDMPATINRTTEKPNEHYFKSVDKILFEKSLKLAAASPGKYEIVTTAPISTLKKATFKSGDGSLPREPLWMRTLVPLVPRGVNGVEETSFQTHRALDHGYQDAVQKYEVAERNERAAGVDPFQLSNKKGSAINEFWSDVKNLKRGQVARFPHRERLSNSAALTFENQLLATGQYCDTEEKIEKWYNRHIMALRLE